MLCMQVETMQSYGIAPTAMTADHGYIAAGAQRGMVRLIKLISPAPVSTSLMQKSSRKCNRHAPAATEHLTTLYGNENMRAWDYVSGSESCHSVCSCSSWWPALWTALMFSAVKLEAAS